MALHRIRCGLDLPILGQPEQKIHEAPRPTRTALLGPDYVGMRPKLRVAVGDTVQRGQLLFEDKKTPGVRYASPGAGTVTAINRGERRALLSVVIDLDEAERAGNDAPEVAYDSFSGKDPAGLSRDDVRALLAETGMWTAFRTRPFSKTPPPESTPAAIFVTAMDTNPLAADPGVVIQGRETDFEKGLICVAKLTDGNTYLCKAPGKGVPAHPNTGVTVEEFDGPHPAGTAGLHIHLVEPAHREKTVWHINYQDVLAIGKLVTTGRLDLSRVVALGGPPVKRPRLLRTRIGADVTGLVAGELADGENRVISGSVLSGRAANEEALAFLGRYHLQVSVLREGRDRAFLGWMGPGFNAFSVVNAFLSKLTPKKQFAMTTATNGSPRAIVPIGVYERVMPLDIQPTFLLRALAVQDIERAEELGCLELDEEDLALCGFVCPGKGDYGPMLRDVLTQIEKEG